MTAHTDRFKPWAERWYHNVPELLTRVEACYQTIGKDPVKVTAKQILECRGWEYVDRELLLEEVEELNCVYVPQVQEPGPMIVFPEYDIHDNPYRAQTKPFYALLSQGKYATLGPGPNEFVGPVWLGTQDYTRKLMLEKGYVVICEGPFDLLALRIAAPEVPSLCSLTKKIGKDHLDYLNLHGIDRVCLMYDNEETRHGETAMRSIQRMCADTHNTLQIIPLKCPVQDPSDCLKSRNHTRALRALLLNL